MYVCMVRESKTEKGRERERGKRSWVGCVCLCVCVCVCVYLPLVRLPESVRASLLELVEPPVAGAGHLKGRVAGEHDKEDDACCVCVCVCVCEKEKV